MASNNPDSSANQSAANSEDAKGDVNAAVEELLNTISNKFAGVSSEIFAKMDEMSRRLDNLEAALLASKEKEAGSSKPS
ncbi:heat shock factor binding protein 1 [Colletotrichum truncatum]|uniref:Heat shock factor binding protein 1 n=1 Tax=Colletotrichum truncatum TaxID=5467 RepID=A0ACC3ZIQ9_COLTU|nr:heat shock factor binding protein 1 [Colletotrichum truncatum]KAF6791834.1 heat shock factor binding protein 1 [Colletotrichum truncatum]